MGETWLPVSGWEGLYEVSDLGRIRTVPRTVAIGSGHRQIPQRIRKQFPTKAGYMIVVLSRGNEVRSLTVHSLVLTAFVGPRPEGLEACHSDGDKRNNALSNLRWDTKHANYLDAVRIGTRLSPERTHCKHGHELTAENVYFTRRRPDTPQCKKCASIRYYRRKAAAAG